MEADQTLATLKKKGYHEFFRILINKNGKRTTVTKVMTK
jgi:hypothetical protein